MTEMDVDWHALFAFSVPPLELIVRGSAIYWFLFLLFRLVLRRDIGAIGVADVLLLVLVADAAQNAMAGEYRSISDGILLVSTIIGWNVAIDWFAYRFPAARRILEPQPVRLVRHGRILHRNLRREFLTVDELKAKLREHGVAELAEVSAAYMESDGEVSVIKRGGDVDPRRRRVRGASGA
jgi:uncharacterized membrane protein YcaP (DUF421 family)